MFDKAGGMVLQITVNISIIHIYTYFTLTHFKLYQWDFNVLFFIYVASCNNGFLLHHIVLLELRLLLVFCCNIMSTVCHHHSFL